MSQLSLLPDADPNPVSRSPSEPIVRSAEIEDNYRWSMRRAWGPGPCISWTLLNPSDADALRDDPTTWRMMSFSYGWGFGSMVVTNIYPFISSTPAALKTWRANWAGDDWVNQHSGGLVWPYDHSALCAWLHNMDVVRGVLLATDTHVAAWGNGPNPDDVQNFLDEVTWNYDTIGAAKYRATSDDGGRLPIEWKCLGRTASGAPIHPLARGGHRVPDDAKLQVWRKAA